MAADKKTLALPMSQGSDIVVEERPTPSYKGLYRFYTHKDLPLLVPAIATSVASGVLVPAFSVLLGKIFTSLGAFGNGQISATEMERQVTLFVIGICIVGAAAWALGWAHMSLWLAFGENTARRARVQILEGLMEKSMAWYDEKSANNGVSGQMNKAVKYPPYIYVANLDILTTYRLLCRNRWD
jgi:ATP-binding cassette subfamily B (MDR/TAP) protein 1